MVHINQVELSHFKSFGGSMSIPLEQGFTVVTGPNGSGKSNILDAVLFCLGLASSRGMRAERLPDLINSAVLKSGRAAETVVSVRFDLSDWQPDEAEAGLEPPSEGPWIKPGQTEWTVSRKLRVAPGGTYASSFSADGEPCNLQQLQTQLRRLRVDPEGSNVVMQGDVTRIVSMSARDRRGIIDELAGVALFDSRIEQTRGKLDAVYESQERCGIVQQELLASRAKLERDCARARTYQELRQRHSTGRLQEQVLVFEEARRQLEQLGRRQLALSQQQSSTRSAIETAEAQLGEANQTLEALQAEVRALGEDQLIAVQAELAGLEASGRELARQADKHQRDAEELQRQRHELARQQGELRSQQQALSTADDAADLQHAEAACTTAEAAVELSRRRLGEVAGRSGSWLEAQKQRSQQRQQIAEQLSPLEAEQQQLLERLRQQHERLAELSDEASSELSSNQSAQEQLASVDGEWQSVLQALQSAQQQVQELAEELALQQRTRSRLEQEQAT
ncbi:MAG: chromosome segregation protein SMC, partial [Cyanobacteria bacterium K_DeepCast_35m_m2_155]|nr:chromosome segregation protein SMC [Cyanobacteria bacterium K_DeepCast_35m_m2_155]